MRIFTALAAMLLAAAPSTGQDPKPGQNPKVDQNAIDAAIERGARYLLGQAGAPMPDEHQYTTELAKDELVFYALIHAGVDQEEPAFKRLLEQTTTLPLKRTYRAVLTALALETLDRAKYQNRIADCAQFLADNQCANGQWGYGEETKLPTRKPVETGKDSGKGQGTKALPRIKIAAKRAGAADGDNSNSQYAALGIRACVQAGIEFDPQIIQKAAAWWEKCQKDGGWPYCYKGSADIDPYGAMTAGGVGSLCIYRWILKQDYKRDKLVTAGLNWMANNFTFDKNPGFKHAQYWIYYWIYAIERAGMLYGSEKIGTHEWYPEGVEWLLRNQQPEGSWYSQDAISDTCFAILFLRRATKPLQKVATGK